MTPYLYPSLSEAYLPPKLITDSVTLHEFKWGGKYWIQNSPHSRLFQHIAEAKNPYQHRFTNAFRKLLGGAARHIIDVGLNIGLMAAQYSTFSEKVSAFEPTPKTIEMAAKNLVINNVYQNVDLYEVALSNSTGLQYFIDWNDHSAINGLAASTNANQAKRKSSVCLQVMTERLDNFKFSDVDGIKIDVEGAELFVLQGADATIDEYKPIVQIELMETSLRRFKLHPQDVFDWFSAKDYRMFNSNLKIVDPNRWVYVRGESDLFFVHKSRTTPADEDPFNQLFAF